MSEPDGHSAWTVVGQLGMLSPDGRRTQSLVCRESGNVQSLSYDRFGRALFPESRVRLSFLKLTNGAFFRTLPVSNRTRARNAPSAVPAG